MNDQNAPLKNNWTNVLSKAVPDHFPKLPAGWTSEGVLKDAPGGGGKIFVTRFTNSTVAASQKRLLVLVHGFGEHAGRYVHFPHYLSQVVDEIVTFDLRGHGRSEGIRGHVDRFDLFTEDALGILREEASRAAQTHLVGHSLGGLVVLRMLKAGLGVSVRSVSVSAPLLKVALQVPALKKLAGRILANVLPSLQLGSELNGAVLSRDPELGRVYEADRLNHAKATPRFFVGLEAAMAETSAWTGPVTEPLQWIIPTADQVVDADHVKNVAEHLESAERQIDLLEGFFHESYNETEKERAFECLSRWIQKHS